MPTVERITLPKDYGATTKTMTWEAVRDQLERAKQYWLAANRASGSPHVVPLDGLWLDDKWWYGGSPETAHSRAVRADSNVTMHLSDPWKVVIVEGEVRTMKNPPEFAERLARMNTEKYPEYGMEFDPKLYAELFALHPRRVIAWSDFPSDLTRFIFEVPSP